MLADSNGRLILHDKPRVTSETWNQQKMLELPVNSFGYQYANWMKNYEFSADERPVAKYVPDVELAYIL